MMCKTIEVPMKLFMCMDKYTKEVFATLLYYDMIAVKDNEGFFSFKFMDFVRFIKGSDKPINAIFNELDRLGIIEIRRTGKSNGKKGKGSDMNKYKINRSAFEDYDKIKNSEIVNNRINIPSYQPKNPNHTNKRILTISDENPNHTNKRILTISDENPNHTNKRILTISDENPNHNGKDSMVGILEQPYSIYNKYILYPDTKEINQKDLESQGYNNTGDILTREKLEKESFKVEQTAKLQNEGEFRGDATIGNKIANADIKSEIKSQSEDKEFALIGNDSSLAGMYTTEQLSSMDLSENVVQKMDIGNIVDYDGNRPNLDVKYFIGKIPDVIDRKEELDRYIRAGLYKLKGVKNWVDYQLYYSRLKKIERSSLKSMEDGYENGYTIEKWQFKKMSEGIQRVSVGKFKYFMMKYSNRPYDSSLEELYQLLGITPLTLEEYRKRLEDTNINPDDVKPNALPTLIETKEGIISFEDNEDIPDDIKPLERKDISMSA